MRVDKNYFPGWTRKSITFTIDDGNIQLDTKFINIVRPSGIKGTFNLCAPDLKTYSADFYRNLYKGFGISNHCKLHPFALTPDKRREISEDSFNSQTADPNMLYRHAGYDGLYHYMHTAGWRRVADVDTYCRLVNECHGELEAVFGEGSITTYVWPYFEQSDSDVQDYVMNKCGYVAVRKTGATLDSTGFAVPSDRMRWSYNANHANLTEIAEKFEAFADDGELKFFAFGVHSHDFERANCWDVLENFAEKYGNRPENYYYASVEAIFAYADAVNELVITDNSVENPTDIDIYVKVDGKRLIAPARSTLSI